MKRQGSYAGEGRTMRGHKLGSSDILGWVFVLPYLCFFAIVIVAPIAFGVFVSLHHWNGAIGDQGFAGVSQYRSLFEDSTLNAQGYWAALEHTVLFVAISVPFLWGIPTGLSFLIYFCPGKQLFRAVFFLPSVLSASAISSVWLYLLATTGGPVNSILNASIPWLVLQPEAWISIDVVTIWWTIGIGLIIMYAGISQVPTSTLEAAAIDGARVTRIFKSIVLPQLRGPSAVVVFMATVASFNLLAQPFLMTHGGPGTSTFTVSYWIYQVGYTFFHMGQATAMAFLFGLIIAGVGFIEYWLIAGRRV